MVGVEISGTSIIKKMESICRFTSVRRDSRRSHDATPKDAEEAADKLALGIVTLLVSTKMVVM